MNGELHHLGQPDKPQQLAGKDVFQAQTLAYDH